MAVSSTTKSYSAINLFESTLINATLLVDQMTNKDMVSAHKFTCRLQEHLMESLNKWVESDSRDKSGVSCASSAAAAAAIYNQTPGGAAAATDTGVLKRSSGRSGGRASAPASASIAGFGSAGGLAASELDVVGGACVGPVGTAATIAGADSFKAPPGKRSKLSVTAVMTGGTPGPANAPSAGGSVSVPSSVEAAAVVAGGAVPSSLQQLQEQLLEQQQRQQQEFRVLQHQRDLQQQQSQMQQMAQLQKQQLQIQQLLAMHKQQAAAGSAATTPGAAPGGAGTAAASQSGAVTAMVPPGGAQFAAAAAGDDFGSDDFGDDFEMDEDEYDSDAWGAEEDEDDGAWGGTALDSMRPPAMQTLPAAATRRRTREDKERERLETLEKLQQVQLTRSCDLDEAEDNDAEEADDDGEEELLDFLDEDADDGEDTVLERPAAARGPVTVRIGRSATNFAEKLPYDRPLAYLMVSGCTMEVAEGVCSIYTGGFGLEFVSGGRAFTVLVAFKHINSLFYNTNNLPSLFISMSEREMERVCAALGTTFHAGQPKMVVGLTASLEREALDSIQRHYETNPSRRFFKMDPLPAAAAADKAAGGT